METYDMITKKFYQKYLLVLFNYPSDWVLRQYLNMSNFLIFGVFQMFFFYIKNPKCHEGWFSQIVAHI